MQESERERLTDKSDHQSEQVRDENRTRLRRLAIDNLQGPVRLDLPLAKNRRLPFRQSQRSHKERAKPRWPSQC